MSLKDTIQKEMIVAMKAKDQDSLRALRAIKSSILLAETETGSGDVLSEETEMKILAKAVKQRKDSATIYKEQNREDLYEKEMVEVEIIEKFLPEQLSEQKVEENVKAIITQTGASSMKDMGKVMGMATKQMAGKAEPKTISAMVKKLLS
ncbi:MAG: hypothetical protein ACJAWV_000076 [Flammeovirgaceae bacterium]|jgi:uncharacterized protein YqeY